MKPINIADPVVRAIAVCSEVASVACTISADAETAITPTASTTPTTTREGVDNMHQPMLKPRHRAPNQGRAL
jgi:hypothetical protein